MIVRRTMPVLLALLLAGCGFFSRPERRFFALQTIPPQSAVVAVSGLPVGIDGLEIPPQNARREIAVRRAGGGLDVRGTELWAGPLEAMIVHTLAFDLAARMPEGMVILPGQARPEGGMRSVDLVFEELSAGPDPVVVLDVRWIVRGAVRLPSEVTRRDRLVLPVETLASANIAAAMSRLLATLADRIVSELAAR